jgi:hypothetical protein
MSNKKVAQNATLDVGTLGVDPLDINTPVAGRGLGSGFN